MSQRPVRREFILREESKPIAPRIISLPSARRSFGGGSHSDAKVAKLVKSFGTHCLSARALAESLDDFRYDDFRYDDFRYNGTMSGKRKQRLKRLPPEYYQGYAWVHWTLTIADRTTGWLDSRLLYKFRELLTHAMFRYQLACPIYCLMPDHIHLLWTGVSVSSDQLPAMKSFRRDLNDTLGKIGFQLQP